MKAISKFDYLSKYWFIIASCKELKNKPIQKKLLGLDFVVVKLGSEIKVFPNRCPHRNVPLSNGWVKNNRLVCPYHGWEFDKSGVCANIPGLSECESVPKVLLKNIEVKVIKGLIWCRLTKGDKATEPYIPGHETNNDYNTYFFQSQFDGDIVNVAESFLDPFHTPFVHSGLIRTDKKRSLNKVRPKIIANGIEVEYLKTKPQSGIVSFIDRGVNRDIGRFLNPGIIELEYHSDKCLEFTNTMYLTPTEEGKTSIYFKASIFPRIMPTGFLNFMVGKIFKFALQQDIDTVSMQKKTINDWGRESFVNTKFDVVRGYLDSFYKQNKPFDKELKDFEAYL